MLSQGWPTPQERQGQLDEINQELQILFCILYFMVEVFRGDEGFAEELSACRRALYEVVSE